MFNMQKMMQQAQKMQKQMQDIQDEMAETHFTGKAGDNQIKIVCNGKYEFMSVTLSPELIADTDLREMIEDLMLVALKDLGQSVSKSMEAKMTSVTSGLNIPGLKLPF
jgi:nucleoid-associated protein EbfC